MSAHLTPGHTKGCTTWTTSVSQDGKSYSVMFVGSASVPGYRLIGNDNYPNIVADYEKTFRVLKSLPCDVFLGSHGSFFSLQEKIKRLRDGAKDAFFDPDGYQRYVRDNEDAFRKELKRQKDESH